MRLKAWHVPVRLATGAFILNSGLTKQRADAEQAARLHDFATSAFPQIADLDPETFATLLSTGEIALGTALLTPFVPSGLAGLALAGFSGGLTRLYWTAPGLRQSGSVRPTQQGIPIAKDTWLLAIGLALVLDAVLDRLPGRRRHR